MANLFGFSLTCGFLGHYAKIHIEEKEKTIVLLLQLMKK